MPKSLRGRYESLKERSSNIFDSSREPIVNFVNFRDSYANDEMRRDARTRRVSGAIFVHRFIDSRDDRVDALRRASTLASIASSLCAAFFRLSSRNLRA